MQPPDLAPVPAAEPPAGEGRATPPAAARDSAELSGAPRARGRRLLAGCAVVALAAVVQLAAHLPAFGLERLHVHGNFTDQAGYVTTARQLVDTGELRTGFLYPAFIDREAPRLYMPGHYVALAASYGLLGWSVFASLLPSLVGFVAAAVGTYLLGNRLYGHAAGLVAALLVVLWPPLVAYACTAMAELTFTAAGVAALLAVALAPAGWRALAVAPALLLPFLFRETGALLVLPAAALVLGPAGARRPGRAVLAAAGAVVLLGAANAWQTATGKVPVPLTWVTDGRFNYGGLYDEPTRLALSEWPGALLANAGRNAGILAGQLGDSWLALKNLGALGTLAACLALLLLGAARVRVDPWPLACGLLLALLVALAFTLYDVKAQKLMRTTLYALPPAAVALAAAVGGRALPPRSSAGGRGALALAVALLAVGSHVAVRAAARDVRAGDATSAEAVELLDELVGDRPGILIAPPQNGAQFAVDRYPRTWCMVPRDERTLLAVCARHDVAAALMNWPIPESLQRRTGLVLERVIGFEGEIVLGTYVPEGAR